MLCPCHSGKKYKACCQPLHEGRCAINALELMRSRYSGYALGKADYIVQTTHPLNPHYNPHFDVWKESILAFCRNTQFLGLKILAFVDGEPEASVTFLATLSQKGQDASFSEKSFFEKCEGKWLYKNGVVS